MLLNLPSLSPGIPSRIDFETGSLCLGLALSMSQTGMITDEDLDPVQANGQNLSVVRQLVEQGWKRAIGGLFDFQILSTNGLLLLPNGEDAYYRDDEGGLLASVILDSLPADSFAVGNAIEAIDALLPGLGHKALSILERPLSLFGTPLLPGGAFDMARILYWQGEDDESLALEEAALNDFSAEDIPRRSALFGHLPEWAYRTPPGFHELTDAEFSAAVARHAHDQAGEALSALDRLRRADSNDALMLPPCQEASEYEIFSPPVMCGWYEAEDLLQVYDDFYQFHIESDCITRHSREFLFSPTPAGVSEALARIRHTGEVLQALDAALLEIRRLNDGIHG